VLVIVGVAVFVVMMARAKPGGIHRGERLPTQVGEQVGHRLMLSPEDLDALGLQPRKSPLAQSAADDRFYAAFCHFRNGGALALGPFASLDGGKNLPGFAVHQKKAGCLAKVG